MKEIDILIWFVLFIVFVTVVIIIYLITYYFFPKKPKKEEPFRSLFDSEGRRSNDGYKISKDPYIGTSESANGRPFNQENPVATQEAVITQNLGSNRKTGTSTATKKTEANQKGTEKDRKRQTKEVGGRIEREKAVTQNPAVKEPIPTIPTPETFKILPENDEESLIKRIGYNPSDKFSQAEPINFPYVIMPKPNGVIKFPGKGRAGRRGFTERNFKTYLNQYFKNDFQIFDDHFLKVATSDKPYEPDFTLIDEKEGKNIYLDIEIDEPYEGLNDINKRQVTHCQGSDATRNEAFYNRGWIVIRFAEIQVHQAPEACCRFIAEVVKSIHPGFDIPVGLVNAKDVQPVKHWTKEEAEVWSQQKYRERYLGIEKFSVTAEKTHLLNIVDTELGEKVEELIKEESKSISFVDSFGTLSSSKIGLFKRAKSAKAFLSFTYKGHQTIIRPDKITETELVGFCYFSNREKTFNIDSISDSAIKDKYYIQRHDNIFGGFERILIAVDLSIKYNKPARIKYRSAKTSKDVPLNYCTLTNIEFSDEASVRELMESGEISVINFKACYEGKGKKFDFQVDRIEEIEILNL